MEIGSNLVASLLQLREIGILGLVHVGTVSGSLDVNGRQGGINCGDQTEGMPWIDRTMHVQHIRCVWMQGTIFAIGVVDGIAQRVGIELLAINVCALLNEEHQRKTRAEHLSLVIGGLVETEFVARLISPLNRCQGEICENYVIQNEIGMIGDLPPLAISESQEVFCISLTILSYL